MADKEIHKKIKEVEIRTNRLVSTIFGGEYRSVFKGRGLEFSELKSYEEGDDPRHIDWKVSRKKGTLQVKKFTEERELTIMLLVDVSNSIFFGSGHKLKSELILELCSLLAFSGIKNNDKVGLLLFSEQILDFLPPKKGRKQVLNILEKIISRQFLSENNSPTRLNPPLTFINKVFPKRIITFLISDFYAFDYEQELKRAAFKHDLIAVIINDLRELSLPDVGLLLLNDPESGEKKLFDTGNPVILGEINRKLKEEREKLVNFLQKNKTDLISLNTSDSFIPVLQNFFRLREKRF